MLLGRMVWGWRAAVLLAALPGLVSCHDPEDTLVGPDRVTSSGANQLMPGAFEAFSPNRLATLITAATPGTSRGTSQGTSNDSTPCDGQSAGGQARQADAGSAGPVDETCRLDTAIMRFNRALYEEPSGEKQMQMRAARNEIQGLLLSASVNRCNVYKMWLRRTAANTQFILGSTAIGVGGVGAVLDGGAASIMSGLSSIFSGVGGEYRQDMLNDLATSVIIPGIEKQRSLLLDNISQARCRSIPDYSLTIAIADALRFHGACSADVGIAAASQALGDHQGGFREMIATAKHLQELNAALAPPKPPASPTPNNATQTAVAQPGSSDDNKTKNTKTGTTTQTRAPDSQAQTGSATREPVPSPPPEEQDLETLNNAVAAALAELASAGERLAAAVRDNDDGAVKRASQTLAETQTKLSTAQAALSNALKRLPREPAVPPLVGGAITFPPCPLLDQNGREVASMARTPQAQRQP